MLTPADFRVSVDVPVRFRDLDALGHVNNAVFFTFLEIARVRYLEVLGSSDPDPTRRFPFLLGEASCRFLSTVSLDDVVRVHVRASKVGTKSFDFEYLLTLADDGSPVATARTTQVSFDFAQGRSMAVPVEFRDKLEEIEGRPLFS